MLNLLWSNYSILSVFRKYKRKVKVICEEDFQVEKLKLQQLLPDHPPQTQPRIQSISISILKYNIKNEF